MARRGAPARPAGTPVTNEHTEVMVDTMEHAVEVAGLLNWCGVHELNPVADLEPPAIPGVNRDWVGLGEGRPRKTEEQGREAVSVYV